MGFLRPGSGACLDGLADRFAPAARPQEGINDMP
jgi:hypothetical protein